MADNSTRKYSFSDFFSTYLSNFGKLLIPNLLFCIPLAILIAGIVLLTNLMGSVNWFLIFLIIPLMSPFFGGLFNVCRKLTADRDFRPVKDFLSGIRDNWAFFLVNSVMLYALTVGMFYMIAINREVGGGPVLIYLIIMLITSIVFLLMDFSATVMAVSVQIGFADIIKNSLMLIIKGFAGHLKVFFSLLFLSFLLYSTAFLIQTTTIVFIVLGAMTALFLPTLIVYIITYNTYQTIDKFIIAPYSAEQKRAKRLQEEQKKDELLTVEDLLPLSEGDPEEYVFLNGKTVKRKTVQKMIEVKKQGK